LYQIVAAKLTKFQLLYAVFACDYVLPVTLGIFAVFGGSFLGCKEKLVRVDGKTVDCSFPVHLAILALRK
jgi:hypothetical protein